MSTSPNTKMDKKIEAFWDWFTEREAWIKKVIDAPEAADVDTLSHALDNLVLDMGRFKWELGQHDDGLYFLTLSPNSDRELLQLSSRIVHAAPPLPQWQWQPALPARPENLSFTLYDAFLMERTVDVANWRYTLRPQTTGQHHLILWPAAPLPLDPETLETVGELTAIAQLGEEKRIRKLEKIVVKSSPDSNQPSQPIQQLQDEVL